MDGEWCGHNLLAAESSAGLLEPGKARREGSYHTLDFVRRPGADHPLDPRVAEEVPLALRLRC